MKAIIWWLLFVAGVSGAIYAIPQLLTHFLGTDNPTLTVISGSMYPVLQRGDLILVKSVTPEEIEPGVVVVFRHENGLAVHRVVRVTGDVIVTRGDANTEEDNPITFDDIVGRVPEFGDGLLKIPLLGKVALMTGAGQPGDEAAADGPLRQLGRYLLNPLGFTLLVLLPAGMLLGSFAGDALRALGGGGSRQKWRRQRQARLKRRWPNARVN